MSKRTLRWWQEVLIALLIAGPLLLFLFWPLLDMDVRPWETGRDIPAAPPDEDRRFESELGVSIVVPPNWAARDMPMLRQVVLNPRQSFPRRHHAGISIRQLDAPPPESAQESPDGIPTDLAGINARLAVSQRAGTFDDPPLTSWAFTMTARDRTWEVGYFLADETDELPPMALRYLETIDFVAH